MNESSCLLLRIPDAAHRLALSRSTIYELIAAGELQPVKIGSAVRIPARELEAWLNRRLQPTANGLDAPPVIQESAGTDRDPRQQLAASGRADSGAQR